MSPDPSRIKVYLLSVVLDSLGRSGGWALLNKKPADKPSLQGKRLKQYLG